MIHSTTLLENAFMELNLMAGSFKFIVKFICGLRENPEKPLIFEYELKKKRKIQKRLWHPHYFLVIQNGHLQNFKFIENTFM